MPASDKSLVPLTKTDFENILKNDSGEYRTCHKLMPAHINCKGSERQQVCLAAQLLSHSVATAFSFLLQMTLARFWEGCAGS